MIKRFLGQPLYAVGNNNVRFLRSNRPTVKISEERFQVMIDLKEYALDEITVKAHPEYLIIEGKTLIFCSSLGLLYHRYIRVRYPILYIIYGKVCTSGTVSILLTETW